MQILIFKISPVHWKVQVEPQFHLCRPERDISDKGTASPAQISAGNTYLSFKYLFYSLFCFIFCWLSFFHINHLVVGKGGS